MSKELPEVPGPTAEQISQEKIALTRMGWAVLALDDQRYHMAELHLTHATSALQQLQRITGGRT